MTDIRVLKGGPLIQGEAALGALPAPELPVESGKATTDTTSLFCSCPALSCFPHLVTASSRELSLNKSLAQNPYLMLFSRTRPKTAFPSDDVLLRTVLAK